MQSEDARAALDNVRAADAGLAERVGHCPPWRHALFGGIMALLIGSIAVSFAVQLAAAPVIVVAIIMIMRSDRKRQGVFVNGYRRGATLPVSLIYSAAMIALVFAAMHMRVQDFSAISKVALAVGAGVLGIFFSVAWQRLFHNELTGG